MSKKISLGVAATIAIIAMAVTFSLTMVVSMKMFNTTVSSVKNKERQYNKLSEIDRFVRAGEYFTIDEDTLNDRLAAGYMNGINDKYAVYYTAKYSEKQSVDKGTLTGIGVAVVNDTSSGYARIIRLYDNSPAAEAGMQVGGFITAINDESTRNITSTARLTSKLLGEEGTTTTITYLTPDRQEQQLNLVHSNYKTPSIYTRQMVADTCGYIRIDAFTSGTASEFKAAVDELLQQGANSLVFDLRDNTGENLNAALVAADYCVPSGEIAKQQDRDGNVTVLRMSDETKINVPIVCLVNGSTAGSAELFANALRKMAGATLVGTKTAGKGVVLSDAQSFSDGSAAYITVGLLLDNEDQTWNEEGLRPDIDAALSVDEQNAYYDYTLDTDPQISKAVNAATALAGQN